MTTETTKAERPKPFLFDQFCKSCGRCIPACPRDAIIRGTEIDPRTGLVPVHIDLDLCNGCGLCLEACPEPFGLMPAPEPLFDPAQIDPNTWLTAGEEPMPIPRTIPDRRLPLPFTQSLVLKGTHASAVGAVLAGCRHFYGYPITPSTEGAELLARLLPELDGVFVQAVSETAAVNMMYGSAAAGKRTMTFTSGPGLSLMLEGISYMVGAELPAVFVNIMRGGPGLGNIAPEQSDIKLVCRGLGHGNTHALVFAPATPQEMLDLTMQAFEIAFRYRNPVIIAGDGYLGQITGRVNLPDTMVEPGLPAWAVYGDRAHRRNLINSIHLSEADLEQHNRKLNEKYRLISETEQRSDTFQCDDAEWILVACNTPARMAKGAVRALRAEGIRVGLFRPITLWPFPINALLPLLPRAKGLIMVEAGPGQLEDELRLALSHARVDKVPRFERIHHYGGILPQVNEIAELVTRLEVARNGHRIL